MKATDLLKKQHRLVEDLFDKFEHSDDREKAQIFEELAANLTAHDAIERELFYPACERTLGEEDDVLGESLIEHGVVEFCLFRADKNKTKAKELEKYVTVLKEVVLHHVKEEEKELLPKASKKMEAEELEELGEKMEERFDKATAADFRRPLTENLQAVLAGKAKTKKESPKTRRGNNRNHGAQARR